MKVRIQKAADGARKGYKQLLRLCKRNLIMIIAVCAIIAFSVTALALSVPTTPQSFRVTILDEGTAILLETTPASVFEIISQQEISLQDLDDIIPSLDTVLEGESTITINRAKKMTVIIGETRFYSYTTCRTVEEALISLQMVPGAKDEVNPSLDTLVTDGMEITFDSYSEQLLETQKSIPYQTKKVNNSDLAQGTTKTITEGENGLKQITTKITFKNGMEIDREVIDETVIKEPMDEVIESGTKAPVSVVQNNVSRGENFRYSRMITVKATAYDPSAGAMTATGRRAQVGVIAVDPRVIPLGTRLYVEAVDGSWTYGYCIAGDTGGAIKGNRIDLFFNTNAEAMRFGVKQANVYILD